MACIGICPKYKAPKPKSGGRYGNGQKRCIACEIFIETDELCCPCCKYKLRTRPRSKLYKAKLRGESS